MPGSASVAIDPSVFSIGQHIENNMVNPTAKIQQDMNAMQVRFNKISSADFRGKSSIKPWKPEVTPPGRRRGSNRGRGGRDFYNMQQHDRFRNGDSSGSQYGSNGQRNGNVLLEIEEKAEEI